MKRADDFAERRKHIANLTDQELYDRFWALTEQVVAPLLELGRKTQSAAGVGLGKEGVPAPSPFGDAEQ